MLQLLETEYHACNSCSVPSSTLQCLNFIIRSTQLVRENLKNVYKWSECFRLISCMYNTLGLSYTEFVLVKVLHMLAAVDAPSKSMHAYRCRCTLALHLKVHIYRFCCLSYIAQYRCGYCMLEFLQKYHKDSLQLLHVGQLLVNRVKSTLSTFAGTPNLQCLQRYCVI